MKIGESWTRNPWASNFQHNMSCYRKMINDLILFVGHYFLIFFYSYFVLLRFDRRNLIRAFEYGILNPLFHFFFILFWRANVPNADLAEFINSKHILW